MVRIRIKRLFQDSDGTIVVWQRPNAPIIIAVIGLVAARIVPDGRIASGFLLLASAALFTWAYLEAIQGVAPIRRVMGVVVLCVIIIGFFIK